MSDNSGSHFFSFLLGGLVGIVVGLLYAPDLPVFLRKPWARHLLRPDALHPHHSSVDAGYVTSARERGYHVHVWTVDEPEDMRRLAEQGVDLIITNRPDLLGQELRPEQE